MCAERLSLVHFHPQGASWLEKTEARKVEQASFEVVAGQFSMLLLLCQWFLLEKKEQENRIQLQLSSSLDKS